jgi:hypothetical protein
MLSLANIRKVLLVAAIFYLVLYFSGQYKFHIISRSWSFYAVLPILLINTVILTSVFLELIGLVISGQRWPDKKFFRFFIPVWIILTVIQTTVITLL